MPRILHIIDSLGHNGAAAQLRVLVSGLAQYGYDVHVAALDDQRVPIPCREGLTEASESATFANTITPLSRRWAADPLALLRLRRLISKLEPDIVQTWNFHSALFACSALETPRQVLGSRIQAVEVRVPRPRLVVGQYRIEPFDRHGNGILRDERPLMPND